MHGTSLSASPDMSRVKRASRKSAGVGLRQPVPEATGGVASVDHPTSIRTIVDVDQGQYDRMAAVGGHPNYEFATTRDEFVCVIGGQLAAAEAADPQGTLN